MFKWYASIRNLKTGRSFEIGERSEAALQKTLREIQRKGYENLDDCSVYIYKEEQI